MGIRRRFDNSVASARWPRKFDLRQISVSHRRKRRRLFRKQAESQEFRDATKARKSSQKDLLVVREGNEISVGTFGNVLLFLVLFKARDIGLGNRYTRLACLLLLSCAFFGFGSSLSSALFLNFICRCTVASRRIPFPLFFRLLSQTESSSEKIPVNLSNLLLSGLSFWISPLHCPELSRDCDLCVCD